MSHWSSHSNVQFDFSAFLSDRERSKLYRGGKEDNHVSACDSSFAVLTGPPKSGKTSLLVEYALNVCRDYQQQNVLFVVFSKEKLSDDSGLPFPLRQFLDCNNDKSNNSDGEAVLDYNYKDVLSRLCFVYPNNADNLLYYVAQLQLAQRGSEERTLIIVDDFGDFFIHNEHPDSMQRAREISRVFCTIADLVDLQNGRCLALFAGNTFDFYSCSEKLILNPEMSIFNRVPLSFNISGTSPLPRNAAQLNSPCVFKLKSQWSSHSSSGDKQLTIPHLIPSFVCMDIIEYSLGCAGVEVKATSTLKERCMKGLPLEKVFFLDVQEPYYSLLLRGIKTVEGRLNRGRMAKICAGSLLVMSNRNILGGHLLFTLNVESIHQYRSFASYLRSEGLERALPGVADLQRGVDIYLGFYSEAEEKECGVTALRVKEPKLVT